MQPIRLGLLLTGPSAGTAMRISSTQGVAPMALQADAQASSASVGSSHAAAARDQWGVIDEVSTLELGGAENSARYRTMAQYGGTLVEWLAAHEHATGLDHGQAIAAEAWLASGSAARADVEATDPPKAQTHRIDLSQVVNKYIGETEKNLDAVLARAQRSDAVLLFDEADALLGRRTDVKDSHDRYAKLEGNDSLQRIERQGGVTMLTTNGDVDP